MTKNIFTHGLIAGFVVSLLMLISIFLISDPSIGMLVGYTSMLIAFSFVFVGVRKYRDTYNNGVISFGKAFRIGIFIVLIASTIYVISWLINYFFFIPDYLDHFSAQMIEELKESGASPAEIDKQTTEMAEFITMYKNPFYNAMVTYMEILPVGLLVTLISSLVLKRKSAKA